MSIWFANRPGYFLAFMSDRICWHLGEGEGLVSSSSLFSFLAQMVSLYRVLHEINLFHMTEVAKKT